MPMCSRMLATITIKHGKANCLVNETLCDPPRQWEWSSVVLVWLHVIRFSFSKKAIKEQKFSFSFS